MRNIIMKTQNKATNLESRWADIQTEDPDEIDIEMLDEIETDGEDRDFITATEVSKQLKEVRAERKKKGDLHVRIASSLHEEIVDDAIDEGISLNQYVATALAYYAGVRRSIRQIKN